MSEDLKDRVKKAVESYSVKQRGTGRKNKKPEEDQVVSHLKWFRDNGFFVKRFESKARMQQGLWRAGGLSYGTPDLMGVGPYMGIFVACEVKAKGYRNRLREGQRDFLKEVIARGGFGVCSDSVEYLETVWGHWTKASFVERVRLLEYELP